MPPTTAATQIASRSSPASSPSSAKPKAVAQAKYEAYTDHIDTESVLALLSGFVDLVLPELRERGLLRESYTGDTLRETTFGRRGLPADHPGRR